MRLTQAKHGATDAVLEAYAYDSTGNRTSATVGGTTTAYSHAGTSHRLNAVGTTARSYDAAGNTTQIGANKSFTYDDLGRMRQVLDNGVVTRNYAYNGLGQQVRTWAAANDDRYSMYGEEGQWLGEYDHTGAPRQEIVWFNGLPVAVLTGSGAAQKVHTIEADALGTPRVVVDPTRGSSGTAIWRWILTGEAFGNTAPNEDPDGDGTPFVFDMRFPGQRFDSASGLNYNYFRDYDTATGRYVESDPIGLAGGASTYGYTGGNPLAWTDQLGLCAQKCSDTPDKAPHHLVVVGERPRKTNWLTEWFDLANPGGVIVTYEIRDRNGNPVQGIHYWQERLSREAENNSTRTWTQLKWSRVDDVHDFYGPELAKKMGVENSLVTVDQWFLIKDANGCIIRLTTVMRTSFQFRNGVQTNHRTYPVAK